MLTIAGGILLAYLLYKLCGLVFWLAIIIFSK